MVAARAKPSQPRAIVAAATRIKLSDKRLVKKQAARRQAWQEDAWEYFDLVGFVKQALWLLGNSIAKTRLFIAVENPKDPDGDPVPITDPASGVPSEVVTQALFELDRLQGPFGGLSEILRELDMNLEVAGEGYLIGFGMREAKIDERTGNELEPERPEEWSVRSTSEVSVTAGGVMKVADDQGAPTKGVALDPDLDTAIRFWLRHPRWSNSPDSAMRGELEDLETLLILSRQRRAEGKSRLPSGLLLIAGDVTAASVVQSSQDDGSNEGTGDPVLDVIADAISDAIEDESSAAGLAPVTLRVPVAPNENVTNKVAKVDLSRTSDQWLDGRIDKLVNSVARGLNLPVESVMGHQQTTYSNAAQVDEDKFYDHIEPRLTLIVDLLTTSFLRPQLTALDENDVPPAAMFIEWAPKLFVWYDPSALLSKPDPAETADSAHDKGTISDEAYRAAKGFSEDDAPTPEEVLIRAALKASRVPPDVYAAIVELLGVKLNIQPLPSDASSSDSSSSSSASAMHKLASFVFGELATHSEPIPVRSTPTHARPVLSQAALARAASDNIGRRLMELDRELRGRILVESSMAMTQALERAGNRAQNKLPEARALTRNMRGLQVLRTLGPSIVAAGGLTDDELLADSFDALEATFMSLGARAQAEALSLASTLGSGFTVEQRDAYGLRQAEDLTEAWAWLKEQLITLASTRMYSPAVDVTLGEFDPELSVPASLIRQSIARAGGTIGVQTSGAGDAWVALADAGARPVGGIGTGELIREAVTSGGGASIEAYRWVYGPALRATPFEPHVDLDGEVFVNFDDEVLANDEGWPEFAFYMPGDHAGCQCDFEPIVLDVSAQEQNITDAEALA